MGRKKYTTAFKQQVVRHYLDSGDGAKTIARMFGVDHGAFRRWTEHRKASGEAGFPISTKHYSAEFKESVIRVSAMVSANCFPNKPAGV
ncbi:Transposase [compost metagenome]